MEIENYKTAQERIMVNTQSLKDLAIYLSGVKDGKGNLLPLGTIVLDDLWNAIKYLQGDRRYISEREREGGCDES
jgi:hypothetical protein